LTLSGENGSCLGQVTLLGVGAKKRSGSIQFSLPNRKRIAKKLQKIAEDHDLKAALENQQ
jgi:hypothetical protein